MEQMGYQRILIFEDDVRFRLNFVRHFYEMMQEADRHVGGWDLLYVMFYYAARRYYILYITCT